MAEHRLTFIWRTQRLECDERGRNVWRIYEEGREVPAHRAALILCDVWDAHWSRGASERLAEMLPRMECLVRSLRGVGVQIIHAPSETMPFYEGSPARGRIQRLATEWLAAHEMPSPSPYDAPPLPVDASDGGSDTNEPTWYKVWTRQHPAISVDEACDVISDDGREIYAFLQARAIQQVFIMGVHTNMCILRRSFGIMAMVRWGVPIALVRDLTDAMYNPARPPYVSHEEGTRLVIEYIEKFWCPTVTSADLLAGL